MWRFPLRGLSSSGTKTPIHGGCRLPTFLDHSAFALGMTLVVKGFGCRLVAAYPPVLRAGVRKPPGKEPAVGGAGGGRLWRFVGGSARASDALSDGVGGGSTIATVGALPVLF